MELHRKKTLGFLLFIFCLFQAVFSFAAEVHVKKNTSGNWELLVDGKPYFIQGMDYRITKVGQSPDNMTLKDWAYYDEDKNAKCDAPYDAWVDKNQNNKKDPDEPRIGDFELMKEMGVNTIRWYMNDFDDQKPNKPLFNDLFVKFGIRIAVGDKFGAYTRGSGASWEKGTDYRDPQQQKRMLKSVRSMVLKHKDEPYTLLWLLGNENNLSFTNTNASEFPEVYAQFVNKAARIIHELDGKHPVVLVNGDTQMLESYKKFCPDVNIFGVNAYRGPDGFGSLWEELKQDYKKPVLVTEYGGSFGNGWDEEAQAAYHKGCWLDIQTNRSGGSGAGNAIGGFVFEWLDEWWKAGGPSKHASKGSQGIQGNTSANWNQEYCGIASQGDGHHSPFLRQLRKVYWVYKKLWAVTR